MKKIGIFIAKLSPVLRAVSPYISPAQQISVVYYHGDPFPATRDNCLVGSSLIEFDNFLEVFSSFESLYLSLFTDLSISS